MNKKFFKQNQILHKKVNKFQSNNNNLKYNNIKKKKLFKIKNILNTKIMIK